MKLVMLKPGRAWRGGCRLSYELRDERARTPLTEVQGTIILALLGNPYLTYMDLAEIIWGHPDDIPDFWLDPLRCRVWKLNRKLARFGQRIVWRQDIYRLEETMPERIAA